MNSNIAAQRIFGEHLGDQKKSIIDFGEILRREAISRRNKKVGSPDDVISAALWEIWIGDVLDAIGRIGIRGRARKSP